MSDSDLTPDEDESVRALLASARHTGPTPPEVVARLDEVLAELAAERREVHAPVVTLASRRRRRASSALLAAAAVVVLGVGVTQVLPTGNESSDSSAGSDSALMEDTTAAGGAESDGAFGANEQEAPTEDLQTQRDIREKAPSFTADSDLAVLVSTAPLRRQVRALRPRAAFTASYAASPECLVDREESEDHVAVTYDGTAGVLVYREPAAGRQQVDLFLCGEADPVESVEIKAR
ncbi:MAG: hypothetical protein JWN68_1089 [Nocardioides sp.]|jgi:hypothetical protein|uniref:hypothetical protein n=1 Tax=Nocardioides sp. TaxID=35761 RepID=UPI002632300A|nr:hypothetical protein [Nocardioides sp.]MCW2833136.1 hypothetical protein [Nocardioides sp.]